MYIFLTIIVLAIIPSTIVAFMARGITFQGPSTDNEVHAKSAALHKLQKWPSRIHNYSDRAAVKIFFVLILTLVQKITKDYNSEWSLTILCLIANAISAILIFLIADSYWNTGAAVVAFGLYICCLWSWHLILHGGPICLAQTCLLGSIYCIQLSHNFNSIWASQTFLIVAGTCFCLTLFSSGSSRKYIPLFLAAFVYSQISSSYSANGIINEPDSIVTPISLSLFGTVAIVWILTISIHLTYKRTLINIYSGSFARLNRTLGINTDLNINTYLDKARLFSKNSYKLTTTLTIWCITCLLLTNDIEFYLSQMSICFGMLISLLWLTLPNCWMNLRSYFSFANIEKWNPRFPMYQEFFKTLGISIDTNMRGAGFIWIPRILLVFAPVHTILFIVSAVALISIYVYTQEIIILVNGSTLILISVSPIFVGELTRGPQISRMYYPSLIGILLFPTYIAYEISNTVSGAWNYYFWVICAIPIVIGIAISSKVFLTDVLPSRMAPGYLGKTLTRLGIKEFYTYDNIQNEAFVRVIPAHINQNCKINVINKLSDVVDGYIVIPGTNSKGFNLESHNPLHADHKIDSELEELLTTKTISQYSVAKFKTMSSSKIWIHESEVTSYRDLILKEITSDDLWRGLAWIIDSSLLPANSPEAAISE